MYICMYMFSQVVWSYLYLRLHAARLFSMMAARKQQQQKGLLTISGHQHRFKYENSSNKSKGPCTQRLKYSYAFFHIHYPTNVPSTETLHIESDASIAKQFRKQYKMESSSSKDDFLIEKRKRKRKYWVHSILRWCREDRAAGYPGRFKVYITMSVAQFDDLLAIQESCIKKEDHQFPCCRTKWINLWDAILVCGIWRTVAPNYQNTSKSLPRIKKMQKIEPNPIFSFLTDESFGGKRDWPTQGCIYFLTCTNFTLCRDLMPLLNLRRIWELPSLKKRKLLKLYNLHSNSYYVNIQNRQKTDYYKDKCWMSVFIFALVKKIFLFLNM